jgi:hypothetical protein
VSGPRPEAAFRPPALSNRLLEWAGRKLDTPDLAADAAELFAERARREGRRAAHRWYRRQARAAVRRLLFPGRDPSREPAGAAQGTRPAAADRPRRQALFSQRRRAARRTGSFAGRLAGFALDAKLGLRMLARYPGLTMVCSLAMAFAIAVGAGTFELVGDMIHPTLPLPEGERIVGLSYWDRAGNRQEAALADDFSAWREQLTTVEDVGGFRSLQRNLTDADEAGEPVEVAQISAAGFRVARTPPLLGRALVETDEEPGAVPVVVLGYRIWQTRFGGDPEVVNTTIRLGDDQTTVVGVMPEGFAFPLRHNVWVPLPAGELSREPGQGRPVRVFGRLAPGATLPGAQAEATTLALQLGAEFPERYEHLTPEVLPYAESILGNFSASDDTLRALIYSINVFPALFLILVCGNVGLLMFARAATRERELLVRNALGAGRGRIVLQLFAEALVLGAVALALGLPAAGLALEWALEAIYGAGDKMFEGATAPFWVDSALSTTTVLYACLLTLLAAAIAGILPALKVTGLRMESRLRKSGAAAGGPSFGLGWQCLIVAQIAATVVFAVVALLIHRQTAELLPETVGFRAEQYLVVPLEVDFEDRSDSADASEEALVRRYGAMLEELERRLAAQPAVSSVAVAERLPLMDQPRRVIELDNDAATDAAAVERAQGAGAVGDRAAGTGGRAAEAGAKEPASETRSRNLIGRDAAEAEHTPPGQFFVNTTAVATDFFELFDAPILTGRGFDSADLLEGANTVVVNQSFVDRLLDGRSAIGRRIRYVAPDDQAPGPWYEIVGVVRNLVRDRRSPLVLDEEIRAQLYHPLSPGRLDPPDPSRPLRYPLHLAVHARGDVAALAPTLRRVAGEVSATIRLEIRTLDQVTSEDAGFWRFFSRGILLVNATALALSLAGIYSVTSFTVARRTREIGVRVALGGPAPRVAAEIFRRPLRLVLTGVLAGCLLMGAMILFLADTAGSWDNLQLAQGIALLLAFGAATTAVCGLACIGPIRRALRVEPVMALGTEG